jgi:hypothetical protein
VAFAAQKFAIVITSVGRFPFSFKPISDAPQVWAYAMTVDVLQIAAINTSVPQYLAIACSFVSFGIAIPHCDVNFLLELKDQEEDA